MATIHFTKDSFEQEVINGKRETLVDFWATWCNPCKMQAPILDELEATANGVTVGKVDVEEEPELAARYGVTSIPTLIVFRNGQEHRRISGLQNKQGLLELLK